MKGRMEIKDFIGDTILLYDEAETFFHTGVLSYMSIEAPDVPKGFRFVLARKVDVYQTYDSTLLGDLYFKHIRMPLVEKFRNGLGSEITTENLGKGISFILKKEKQHT